ncbi:MAG: ATP-binding protein, partial [Xanthomonadales bacterium]|nr:ATP-binding protein [Xanthomonadales bacterium]
MPQVLQNSAGGGTEQAEWLPPSITAEAQTDRGRARSLPDAAAKFKHRDLARSEFGRFKVEVASRSALFSTAEFTERAENVVLVGGTGTGRTHLATALGIQAITPPRQASSVPIPRQLVNQLEQEKAAGRSGRLANQLSHLDLVILVTKNSASCCSRRPARAAVSSATKLYDHQASSSPPTWCLPNGPTFTDAKLTTALTRPTDPPLCHIVETTATNPTDSTRAAAPKPESSRVSSRAEHPEVIEGPFLFLRPTLGVNPTTLEELSPAFIPGQFSTSRDGQFFNER